jgi:hypothetical protein
MEKAYDRGLIEWFVDRLIYGAQVVNEKGLCDDGHVVSGPSDTGG